MVKVGVGRHTIVFKREKQLIQEAFSPKGDESLRSMKIIQAGLSRCEGVVNYFVKLDG